MSNISFEAGEGAWSMENQVLQQIYEQPDTELLKLFDEKEKAGLDFETQAWKHPGDFVIRGVTPLEQDKVESKRMPPEEESVRLYFDGGCRKNQGGVGGFICFSPTGECLGGRSLYFGSTVRTSNEAEA